MPDDPQAAPTVEEELEQTKKVAAEYQARVEETEALVGFLRERTAILNLEIRHRDRLIADRDRAIIDLSMQLEAK